MRIISFTLLLGFLITSCSVNSTLRPITKDKEWQTIFNGKDLRGWTGTGKFESEVKNEAIYLYATHPNNNAWLLSEKNYRNFRLQVEFLMKEEGANSGVVFRYNDLLGGMPNSLGYEANIDWRTDIQAPLGSLEHAARAKLLPDLKKDDWNKITIEARSDHLRVFINESLVCETHNRRSLAGKIGLQVPITKGDTIAFRRIRIQELADSESSTPPVEDYYRSTFESRLEPLIKPEATDQTHQVGGGKWEWQTGGILHGYSDGANSFLVTNETYRNFYLKGKFKIAKEDNSGIFIRKHPDSTGVSLQNSLECNIYDHNGYSHAYSTGSIVSHARAWSYLVDYDDWNTMEIFAHESLIILYVNGQKASETHVPKNYNQRGSICLQAGPRLFSDQGSSHIYFKDLMIKNMDGAAGLQKPTGVK